MGRITNKLIFLVVIAFGIWYLLRKTTLGTSFSNDMFKMSGYANQSASEGLDSARKYF